MPRKAIDYSHTIIYKICCNDPTITDIYIGHTTDFTCRKNAHKTSCNSTGIHNHHCYVYEFIRNHGGWDNWSMIEIERISCIDKNNAYKHERYYIEALNATLNKQCPISYTNKYMIDDIINNIKISKPEISETTCVQHARTIHKIYTTLWPDDINFLVDRIVTCPSDQLLSTIPNNRGLDTSKAYAAALGIFTKRPEFSKIVSNANRQYEHRISDHIPTQRELNDKMSSDDIIRIDKELHNEYKTNRCSLTIKRWLLWCLVSGKYIPPRRNLDWISFKIRNIDQDKDNYLDHTTHTIIINRYKTQHIYGQDCIRIPDILHDLFVEYTNTHPYDWLFPTNNGKCIHAASFNTMVNKLSDSTRGHGTNQYRKTYLQTNFGNIINLHDTMRKMGSSSGCINSYVKDV